MSGRMTLVRSTDSFSVSWRSSSLTVAGSALSVDDGVDALGVLVDLVGQPTAAPDVDLLDGAAVVADDVEELSSDGATVRSSRLGVEDDHQFVVTHAVTHLLWTQAATDSPWQEGGLPSHRSTDHAVPSGRPGHRGRRRRPNRRTSRRRARADGSRPGRRSPRVAIAVILAPTSSRTDPIAEARPAAPTRPVLPRRPAGLEGPEIRRTPAAPTALRRRPRRAGDRPLRPRALRGQRGVDQQPHPHPAPQAPPAAHGAAAEIGAQRADRARRPRQRRATTPRRASTTGARRSSATDRQGPAAHREHRRRRQRDGPPPRARSAGCGTPSGDGSSGSASASTPATPAAGGIELGDGRRPGQGHHRPHRPGARQRQPGRLRLRARPARQLRRAARLDPTSCSPRSCATPAPPSSARRRAAQPARPPTSPACGSGCQADRSRHADRSPMLTEPCCPKPKDDRRGSRACGSRSAPSTGLPTVREPAVRQLPADAGLGRGEDRVARRVARLVRRRATLVGAGLVLYRQLPTAQRYLAYLPEGPVIDWDERRPGRWHRRRCSRHLAQRRALRRPDRPAGGHPPLERRAGQGRASPIRPVRRGCATSPTEQRGRRGARARRAAARPGWRAPGRRRAVRAPASRSTSSRSRSTRHAREDDVLAGMNQLWRRNIKKAAKAGVEVDAGHARGPARRSTSSTSQTAERDHFTPRPLRYFQTMFDALRAEDPDRIRLYLAHHEGDLVAATIWVRVGAHVWYSYGASLDREARGPRLQRRPVADDPRRDRRRAPTSTTCAASPTPSTPTTRHVGLIQFKVGTGGEAVEYAGEWDLPAQPAALHTAFDLYMSAEVADMSPRPARRRRPLARPPARGRWRDTPGWCRWPRATATASAATCSPPSGAPG